MRKGVELTLKKNENRDDLINITTVYDNIPHHPDFKSDWGLGASDHPKARILFDTGAKPEILKANLERPSISPDSLDIVVISHKHWDHKGGVSWVVEQNPHVTVYMPATFMKTLEKQLLRLYTPCHRCTGEYAN